jgi:hypothetical protein
MYKTQSQSAVNNNYIKKETYNPINDTKLASMNFPLSHDQKDDEMIIEEQ